MLTKMSTSSGSTNSTIINDQSSRINSDIRRTKNHYAKKASNFDKDIDMSLSKITSREKVLRDSMLAYTTRMRNIAQTRERQLFDSKETLPEQLPLLVQAKHIPRFPPIQSRRRPASLDELLGKQTEKVKREPPRSASKLSLPSLPERLTQRSHHVKISFVSASDLYDFVDFSIRNKAPKAEAINLKREEEAIIIPTQQTYSRKHKSPSDRGRKSNTPSPRDVDRNDLDRQNSGSSTDSDDNHDSSSDNKKDNKKEEKETPSDLPPLSLDALKVRPNRAKRMQLRQPHLNIIPENEIIAQKTTTVDKREVISPPPKQSPRNMLTSSSLSAIPETEYTYSDSHGDSRKKIKNRKTDFQILHGIRTGAMAKLEPLHPAPRSEFQPHLKTKMKAQKKFRRLIYLRDVPEKHYHRI